MSKRPKRPCIGIVGSRLRDTEADKVLIREQLLGLIKRYGEISMVSGGCPKGADLFAEQLAHELRLPIKIHYPDKSQLDEHLMTVNPRLAYTQIYYARNTLIAQDADTLIACVTPDRKGGTEDTIRKFDGELILV